MNYKKLYILTLIFSLFLTGITIYCFNQFYNLNIEKKSTFLKFLNIKNSDLFTSQIDINDISTNNWTWAKNQGYCTGLGTESDPYIIRDNIFSVGLSSCLIIRNSIKFFEIINCTFIGSDATGLYLNNVENGKLLNNTAQNNNIGIHLLYSSNIEISECNIISNDQYNLFVENSDWNNITKNKIIGKNNGDTGIFLDDSNNNTITNNFADNFEYTCISLEFSDDNNVSGNNGTRANIGINSHYSYNNSFFNNIMNDNDWGIYTNHVNNHYIAQNLLSQNFWAGFYSIESSDNYFTQNNVTDNYYEGIVITSSSFIISNNDVSKNDMYGIRFQGSSESVIIDNYIFENIVDGIRIETGNNNINITNNLLENNDNNGIILNTGAMGVLISNNSFIGNFQHAEDNGINNYWDNGTVGNFWDNYTGIDLDDNGLGDTPYIYIFGSAGSQDNNPIWEDGDDVPPIIIIISPSNSTAFFETPTIKLFIYDYYSINTTWYTILELNRTFMFSGNTVEISNNVWDLLKEGAYTIVFYVNDTVGHLNHTELLVIKKNQIMIPFGNFFLIFFLTITILLLIILKRKNKFLIQYTESRSKKTIS